MVCRRFRACGRFLVFDFWMSFGLGAALAVALIGIYQLVRNWFSARRAKAAGDVIRSWEAPKGRGDIPMWAAIGLYMLSTLGIVAIAWALIPQAERFIFFFLFFGLIFTPFQAFVDARLVGMVGQTISIPYVRETTILLSGYPGVDIWFVPFPLSNYGAQAQKFREIELTGTSFKSIIKAEVVMIPIVLIASFLYSSYIWKLAPVPSASYPYAQMMWRLRALQTCLWYTGTLRSEMHQEPEKRQATWTPSNLVENRWWYWRVKVADQQWIDSRGEKGEAGPWSEKRAFYVWGEKGEPDYIPEHPPGAFENPDESVSGPAVEVVSPAADHGIMRNPRPSLAVRSAEALPEGWHYYFAVDADPYFTSPWIQNSSDEPWLFRALKPWVITIGGVSMIALYIIVSIVGLPLLIVFGAVRALTTIPHFMITEFIGALLARYYFWNKYGKQEWRTYAPVLAVGFACGMALMGMASISIALIQKSVSVLIF